jgi:Glycosyltransferase
LSPGQALVGNIAALADHKDYFTFLRTVQLLQKRDCPAAFFIIGTGPQEQEIKSYAAHLGLHKNLYFTGFRNDIPAILPELDILLFTSKTEGLGTSILDAQAAGTPVVATAGGGIPEIVRDGYNGRLCPVGDEVALAAAVEDLLAHPPKAQKLRKEAQKAVRRFAKAETARETLRHYRELV